MSNNRVRAAVKGDLYNDTEKCKKQIVVVENYLAP